MATKKTVKKAPAVVRDTPEVQEARADGEYNKYPVYHGCLRFDDDNIVSSFIDDNKYSIIKINDEEVGGSYTSLAEMLIVDPTRITPLGNKITYAYFNTDPGSGDGTNSSVINIGSKCKKLAFADTINSIDLVRILSTSSRNVDVYLNKEPTSNFVSLATGASDDGWKVHCNFSDTGRRFGFVNATFIFNESFPGPAEILMEGV